MTSEPVGRHEVPLPVPAESCLPRDRLVARVLATPPAGLCLISAPPGYGGTTLMALTARRTADRIAWVSLTRADAAPAHFWTRLAAVVRAAAAGPGTQSGLTGAVAGEDGLASGAAAAVSVAGTGPLLVVVDDLDPQWHAAVTQQLLEFVEAQPSTCRTVVRTRAGGALGLAHLLTSGRLVTLGRDDLTLDRLESDALISTVAPGLGQATADALVELAEGWMAPLAMALRLVATDTEADPVAWLRGPALDPLFDAELQRLDPDQRELLLACAVLDVLTAEGCDRLRGAQDSDALLAAIQASGTLAHGLPDQPLAVRLHPLFSAFLRRRLALRGRSALADAHRAAADHLRSEGDPQGAIVHLVDAGDPGAALALLGQHLAGWLNAGRSAVVRQFYSEAGGPPVEEHHVHALGSAWADLMSGDVEGARRGLALTDAAVASLTAAAGTGSEREPQEDPASGLVTGPAWMTAEAGLLRAYIATWTGHPARAVQLVDRVREFYGDSWQRSAHQAAAMLAVRARIWSGDLAGARAVLTTVAGKPGGHDYYRHHAIPSLSAAIHAEQGRAYRSRLRAESALSWLDDRAPMSQLDGLDAHLALALALTDLDQLQPAWAAAEVVAERSGALKHVTYAALAQLRLAQVLDARGEVGTAYEVVREVRALLRSSAPGSDLRHRVDAVEARLRVQHHDQPRATQLVRSMQAGPDRDLLQARLHLGEPATSTLRRVHAIRPATPRQRVELRLLLALCHVRARRGEAENHLLAAAEAAFELGLHRALVGWPEELEVLAEDVARDQASEAVTRLLWVARPPHGHGTGLVAPVLSEGERALITVLAGSSGNTEIATALGISVNTVKTRLRRLYTKLEVHSRQEAVDKARALGLLAPNP